MTMVFFLLLSNVIIESKQKTIAYNLPFFGKYIHRCINIFSIFILIIFDTFSIFKSSLIYHYHTIDCRW